MSVCAPFELSGLPNSEHELEIQNAVPSRSVNIHVYSISTVQDEGNNFTLYENGIQRERGLYEKKKKRKESLGKVERGTYRCFSHS